MNAVTLRVLVVLASGWALGGVRGHGFGGTGR